MSTAPHSPYDDIDETDLRAIFEKQRYIAEDDIVTTVLLALRLKKPLLVEGEPGSGKTELARVLADGFATELVRLQCYEGLAAENALYEWNYAKQLLAVQAGERGVVDGETVFDEEYLLERPLLRSLVAEGDHPPVLLIDEVDRADEEFEALLLEVLSDFQISIPELGTITAARPPVVIITSNRTRGLSDALKRRCLYLHIGPPSFEKEHSIVRRKVPQLDDAVASEVCAVVGRLRDEPLLKDPGVAETLDLARAVTEVRENGDGPLTEAEVRATLGCILKEAEDVGRVNDELIADILAAAATTRGDG